MTPSAGTALNLEQLPSGSRATVRGLRAAAAEADDALLRRLGEIGFVPGESVHLLRRGPGGREPLAVQVGDTMFALRALEARCIVVEEVVVPASAGSRSAPPPARRPASDRPTYASDEGRT